MKLSRRDDPWELRKDNSDPWNSLSYRRRERQLLARMGMEDDCAFSLPKHHMRTPSSPQRRAASYRSPRRIDISQSAKNPAFVACLIAFLLALLLFVSLFLFTFIDVVVGMALSGSPLLGATIWLESYLPMLLVLLFLTVLFFNLTKKQARS